MSPERTPGPEERKVSTDTVLLADQRELTEASTRLAVLWTKAG